MDSANDPRGRNPRLTRHALATIEAKGFCVADVLAAYQTPARVYPSGSHPGQWRITGRGLCLVGVPNGDTFVIITVYLDGVVTPVRPDQMATAEGRRFAQYGRKAGF